MRENMTAPVRCLPGFARLPNISGIRSWTEEKKGTSQLDENLVSPKAALEEELCIKEEKMELFRKVHVLEETAKEVVLLRLTGEFSFREIGDIFGKNENWARVTFYRAKQKLVKG